MGRRLGIEEPQLMKIMRATLHTHNEWFKLQMGKDRFEEFLKIDSLKEVNSHFKGDIMAEAHADISVRGFSQSTSSSSNKLPEDNSSPSQASSNESPYDENAIIKVMVSHALTNSHILFWMAMEDGSLCLAV